MSDSRDAHRARLHDITTRRTPAELRGSSAVPFKHERADLRRQYNLMFEVGLAFSLLIVVGLFHVPLQANDEFEIVLPEQEVVEMDQISQTKQIETPPPPPRPQVPVAVADETILEDDDLDLDASLDLEENLDLPTPPPPPVEEEENVEETEQEIFVIVEEMPEIIGGTEALYELIEYPEMARRAGVEGLVIVQVVVEPDGRPSSPVIAKSAGGMLDDAAVTAVMQLEFHPGRQRTKPVRVKVAIPVRFKLKDDPTRG